MKKKAFLALIFISIFAFCGLFFACSAVVSVEFETSGGSEVKRQLLSNGSVAERPENPVRTGYSFKDWYADKEFNHLFDFKNTRITKNTIIYAKWTVNNYTIRFVTTGTAVSDTAFDYAAPLNAFVESYRTGYRFTGWYTDAACTKKFEALTMPAENLTLYAGWQSDPGYSAFTFSKNETGYTLVSVEDMRLSILPVPDTYNNLPVTKVGKFAFELVKNIPAIELPDSIIAIEESAFEGCTALKRVKLPPLDTFSPRLFYGCVALESVDFADGLISVGAAAFYGCVSMADINMPEGLESIGERAFYGCVSLTEIKLPDSVSSIGERAFSGCKLTAVRLPEGLTHLGSNAFYNCDKLAAVDFGENIQSIGSGVFENCTALSLIDLPDSVVRLESRAFAGTGLVSVTLPAGIKEIGDYLFMGCNALETMKLLNGSRIGDYMFLNCGKLKDIDLSENLTEIGNGAFENCIALKNVVLPDKLESIGVSAFRNCAVEEIDLPAGIKEIPKSAFENCRSLIRAGLPDGLIKIDEYAFSDCFKLENVPLPSLLVSIANRAFLGCSRLSVLDFGENLLYIGGYALEGTGWLRAQGEGDVYAGSVLYLYRGGTIKQNTSAIAGSAFFGNSELTVIEIPESVTVIGDSAFENCTALEEVSLFAVNIGIRAFAGCTSLLNIRLGENLKAVSDEMFYRCEKLDAIVLPAAVSEIGLKAFYSCAGLKTVTFGAESRLGIIKASAFELCKALEKISLPGSLTELGSRAFYGCDGLKNVTFGAESRLGIIKASAFELCKTLKEISLPDSLMEIAPRAFYGCEGLKSVTFGTGSRLDVIKASAFELCKALEEIKLPDSLTEIMSFAFKETALRKIVIGTGIKYIREQIVLTTRIDAGEEIYGIAKTEEQRSLTVIIKGEPLIGLSSFVAGDWLKIILPDDFCLQIKSGSAPAGKENWTAYSDYIYSDNFLRGDWVIQDGRLIAYLGAGGAGVELQIKIPDAVVEIAPYVFSGMDFITSVRLNFALETIGECAFYATSIFSLDLHGGISFIGAKAFWVKGYLYKIDIDVSEQPDSYTPALLGINALKIKGYYSVLGDSDKIFYKFDGDSAIYVGGKILTEVDEATLNALENEPLHKKIIFLNYSKFLPAYQDAWTEYCEFITLSSGAK